MIKREERTGQSVSAASPGVQEEWPAEATPFPRDVALPQRTTDQRCSLGRGNLADVPQKWTKRASYFPENNGWLFIANHQI